MDQAGLGAFLRHKRDGLTPADVGIDAGSRRRAPGLRREEVAVLAGMSADYYRRLEQGRGPLPSVQILSALTRAMRLTRDECDYVLRAAGHALPPAAHTSPEVAPRLLRVLERLHDTPALVISDLAETLAANHLAEVLIGDHSRYTGLARHDAYRWFVEPRTRDIYPVEHHDERSRSLVANLRAAHGRSGENSRAGELVRVLLQQCPEFATLWHQHEVARRFGERKTLVHPVVGPLELDCQVLFTEDEGQALLVFTAEPGSAAERQLEVLRGFDELALPAVS